MSTASGIGNGADGSLVAASSEVCEAEPIELLGFIQSYGVLVVSEVHSGRVTHVSDNAHRFFGQDPPSMVGKSLVEVLPPAVMHRLITSASVSGAFLAPTEAELNLDGADRFEVMIPGVTHPIELLTYVHDGHRYLELLPAAEDRIGLQERARLLEEFSDVASSAASLYAVARKAVEIARRGTGYDRVLMYVFDERRNGEVIAEVSGGSTVSYLGLRFPATDIPLRARKLYARYPLRCIADVAAKDAQIFPRPRVGWGEACSDQPIDLSPVYLRGVSRYHIDYLRNMGVRASASVSVLSPKYGSKERGDEALWGLLACHHSAPFFLSWGTRQFLLELSRRLSSAISALEASEMMQARSRAEVVARRVRAELADSVAPLMYLLCGSIVRLSQIVPCDGFGVVAGEGALLAGDAPPLAAVKEILAKVRSRAFKEGAASRVGSGFSAVVLPTLEGVVSGGFAGGALLLPLSPNWDPVLLCSRREVVREVYWGGDPGGRSATQ